ncbi:hypothetical protein TSTA_100560 [Talaromyces stipitatus ATCC 10500]|uniref:DUF7704 domain-containing protein n=1 Tax=Talaromyces stipitatus (strain ATCC 10500 / CBS 375.48 / QM 6759 / NRRL 1006) TaxID=441959 RepID=B8MMQ6_TALSN|nr:uncharacterized protein TSTA_100560 [Talaromyces stipitatus ATCC 10500]EED13812.1 hypothetical protein TSTA_100560 [Talaromyces stipitatus ATCC 10500]
MPIFSTLFPTWPFILFGVLEPLTMVAGALAPIIDTNNFIAGQTSLASPPTLPHHPSVLALNYQLANIYGLVGMLGVGLIYGTSEIHVLRNAVVALSIADLGHLYATYAAMGPDTFFDVASWSLVSWGNIGFTAFLFVNRIAYLLGLFGSKTSKSKKRN